MLVTTGPTAYRFEVNSCTSHLVIEMTHCGRVYASVGTELFDGGTSFGGSSPPDWREILDNRPHGRPAP